MLKKLFPLVLPVVGLGIGVGAGLALRPHPAEDIAAVTQDPHDTEAAIAGSAEPELPPEYAKMNNQFVVPVLDGGRVVSMVILSLSIEVPTGGAEQVYEREPKLRDVFLQVLFDHANAGGFRGAFTDGSNMVLLRRALLEAAKQVLADTAKDVLITEIVRQDS